MFCSICRQPIVPELSGWALGHNACPVNSGRCCGACNDNVVIPARLTDIYAPKTAHDELEQLLDSVAADIRVVLNCLVHAKPDYDSEKLKAAADCLRDLKQELFSTQEVS